MLWNNWVHYTYTPSPRALGAQLVTCNLDFTCLNKYRTMERVHSMHVGCFHLLAPGKVRGWVERKALLGPNET